MDYTFDHDLFLLLNFDGGPVTDKIMVAVSGVGMWIPMYVLMLWLVWRRTGWRGTLLFLAAAGIAMGLSDMVCGVFKHSGPLGNLLPDFPPRWRPMFTPELEGLDISPDSLMVWRRNPTPDLPQAVHIPGGMGGRYGTVSAHAATIVSIAVLSANVIRRRWYGWTMVVVPVLICYSRIYLAKHFPGDLVLGSAVGATIGWLSYRLWHAVRLRTARPARPAHRRTDNGAESPPE